MLRDVEQNSRLQVTDLVNNTNLSYDTQVHDILQGQKLIRQVSQAVGVPITYIAGRKELLEQLPENIGCALFPVHICMKPPWDRKLTEA